MVSSGQELKRAQRPSGRGGSGLEFTDLSEEVEQGKRQISVIDDLLAESAPRRESFG